MQLARMGNGRIAWSVVLGKAKAGDYVTVPHADMFNARVALSRYKQNNPRFDYTTKTERGGLRIEIKAAA